MPRVPPKGRPIAKGEVRNPKGSSAKARAIAKIRRLSADDIVELTTTLLVGTRADMNEVAKNEAATFLQVWTAKLLVDSYKNGDVSIYRAIMDRVVGTPKQTVALGGDDKAGPIRVDSMTKEEKVAKAEALRKARLAVEAS